MKRIGISEIIGEARLVGGGVVGAAIGGLPGAAIGGAIGMVMKLGTSAISTANEQDVVRKRIVEAWSYRGAR